MINNILQLDSFSKTVTVFFRKPAGLTAKILVMSLVSSVGIMLYFFVVFDSRTGSEVIPDFVKISLGLAFALAVASGSYVCALNQINWLGNLLFLIDGLISSASYSAIFLTALPTVWAWSMDAISFCISLVISLSMAWTPAIMIKGYSNKLKDLIYADKNDSKTFDLFQELEDRALKHKTEKALGVIKENKSDFELELI